MSATSAETCRQCIGSRNEDELDYLEKKKVFFLHACHLYICIAMSTRLAKVRDLLLRSLCNASVLLSLQQYTPEVNEVYV